METSPEPKVKLSQDRIWAIIETRKESMAQTQPPWYHLACHVMPFFAQYAQALYIKRRQMQGLRGDKEEKTTPLETWSLVEADLRQQLPAEFSALPKLMELVDFWTHCDEEKIKNLFVGLHTENERLDALLGRSFMIPQKPIGRISSVSPHSLLSSPDLTHHRAQTRPRMHMHMS